jgi:hypothetical protein
VPFAGLVESIWCVLDVIAAVLIGHPVARREVQLCCVRCRIDGFNRQARVDPFLEEYDFHVTGGPFGFERSSLGGKRHRFGLRESAARVEEAFVRGAGALSPLSVHKHLPRTPFALFDRRQIHLP